MSIRFFALALASSLTLPAQTSVQPASPFRFAPADSTLVVRFAAPAKWKQQFAKTQVAKLFGGPTLAPMVAQVGAMIDQGLAELRAEGGMDADLVEKLLTEYRGDYVIAATVDLDGIAAAMAEGRPPHFGVAIAMTPDGSYELGKLAESIAKLAEDDAPEGGLRDLQVGDVRLRWTDNEDEPDVSVPQLVDGHLVMLVSDDLAKFAPLALEGKERFGATGASSATSAAAGSALHAHVRLAPIMKAIAEAVAESGQAPFDVAPMFDALGLTAMDTASMTIAPDGKYVAADGELRFGTGDRGLFAMLPPGRGAEKLLRLVPPGSETFSVTTADLGALYRVVGKVWQGLGDTVPMTWEQAQTAFAESMKVRLKEDLFDHLGTETLTLQDVDPADMDPEDPLNGIAGTTVGFTLKNGKAFGESVEKMLRARGLHAARKTEEYQGTQVHRMRLAAIFELEYAVTDDLLLLALGNGEAARRSLRGVLDARANPPATVELPAPVKERLALLPPDWSGMGVTSVADSFAMIGTTMEQAMSQAVGEVPPEAAGMIAMLKQLGGDLDRFGLKQMVSTMHSTANALGIRVRW